MDEHTYCLAYQLHTLLDAVKPFVKIGIPANWPDECVLTWLDHAEEHPGTAPFAYIGYLHSRAKGGPAIADYRRLSRVVERIHENSCL
jgi:hypothetical protein